jgi:cell division protein FtsB
MAKRKMTPFARLLIFLIIFLPLAYLAAAYINGEDGIANVKRMVGMENEPPRTETVTTAPADRAAQLEQEIQRLEQELAARKAELETLRQATQK